MVLVILLGVFWIMQVAAAAAFKYGSLAEGQWTNFFILGNIVGISSTWLLMHVYARLMPNVALALSAGGAFLCSQVALAIIFHARLTPIQWVGVLVILVGMVLAAGVGPSAVAE